MIRRIRGWRVIYLNFLVLNWDMSGTKRNRHKHTRVTWDDDGGMLHSTLYRQVGRRGYHSKRYICTRRCYVHISEVDSQLW